VAPSNLAISASSSATDLPPAATAPMSGSDICPAELTWTVLLSSGTPKTVTSRTSDWPIRYCGAAVPSEPVKTGASAATGAKLGASAWRGVVWQAAANKATARQTMRLGSRLRLPMPN
jgi:hypothetical protein